MPFDGRHLDLRRLSAYATGMAGGSTAEERAERLAKALRDNLRRRKARARADPPPPEQENGAEAAGEEGEDG